MHMMMRPQMGQPNNVGSPFDNQNQQYQGRQQFHPDQQQQQQQQFTNGLNDNQQNFIPQQQQQPQQQNLLPQQQQQQSHHPSFTQLPNQFASMSINQQPNLPISSTTPINNPFQPPPPSSQQHTIPNQSAQTTGFNPLQPPPASTNFNQPQSGMNLNAFQPPPSTNFNQQPNLNPLQQPPSLRQPTPIRPPMITPLNPLQPPSQPINSPQPPTHNNPLQPPLTSPLQPPPLLNNPMQQQPLSNPLQSSFNNPLQPPPTTNPFQPPLNNPLQSPPSNTTQRAPFNPSALRYPPPPMGSVNTQPTFSGGNIQPPTNFQGGSMQPPPTNFQGGSMQPPPMGANIQPPPMGSNAAPGGQPFQNYTQFNQNQPHGPPAGPSGFGQAPGLNQQPGFNQPQQQQQQQQRIDPDAIPNPIDVMKTNTEKASGIYKSNETGQVPPLVTTNFICKDEGISNPRFIRSTLYSIPATQDLIKHSKLPMALSVTPFAKLKLEPTDSSNEVEMEPPISNLGELGPVRCKRCKAYMSPYMQFIDNGRRFQCPYCEDITPVPQEYFNHLDHMGKRVDMYERPELCLGSYEFLATKDYCRNQQLPNPPSLIFMIDVSANSIRSGLLKLICEHIKNEILPNLPKDVVNSVEEESPVRVGFITYDKELHFYNLKNTLVSPQMMIVSDIEEMFVPILDGFLVKPNESKSVIESLLDQLPQMFADNKEADLLLGPVIEAGIEALVSAKCPGKLFIFHTNIPSAQAPGQLKSTRDDRKILGTDKEKQLLTPQSDYYTQLGKKCVEAGCSISFFLTSNQYCDLASISDCIRKCAGQIFKYDFFMADTHGERLIEDLKHSIKNTYAFDAVMRIRTSTGIRAVDYLGNFNQSVNDVEFAACDRLQSFCAELKHEDKLNENSKVYIQCAILYTSLSGQRRIRIHNLNLSVCTQYNQLYPSCDLDTIVNYIAKLALRSITQSTPKSIQENIISQVAHILACYRKNCANAPARGQFILPETLKLIPLFINSLLKSEAISGAKTVTTDERVYHMYRLMSMDVLASYTYFYPTVIPLLEVEDVNSLPQVRCSYDRLQDDGLYLLENGLIMYLWIGSNVPSTIIQNLFGTPQIQQINIEKCKLVDIDTPISKTVRDVINKINEQRNSMLRLIVVRQKDTLEAFFRSYLVEDKNIHSNAPSYVDFLFQLHHEIRNILS